MDKDETINLETLLTQDAEEFAKKIVDKSNSTKDTSNQIRRFYDELIKIQTKSKEDCNNFATYKPAIYILISRASYSYAKGTLSKEFKEFLDKRIRSIGNQKDLDNFILFFEAIIGYMKYYEKLKQEKKQQEKYQNQQNERRSGNANDKKIRNHNNR